MNISSISISISISINISISSRINKDHYRGQGMLGKVWITAPGIVGCGRKAFGLGIGTLGVAFPGFSVS